MNVQVVRQAPGSRFITLFYGVFDALSGEFHYVNAGHTPALVIRRDGSVERLSDGGMALGMFDRSTYSEGLAFLGAEDLLAIYSDGITEAESPAGKPFDEQGLERTLQTVRHLPVQAIGSAVVSAVEQHTADRRFADDLTILLLRRTAIGASAASEVFVPS